ncbi:MAG: sodium/proton-translocating pyrophosphatase, partial [Candidatus Omnitrophica bacterium]|nr:sodium/proton-translocating pyrophosphatase [Candidatus Omnitrophota bacterium]
MPKLSSVKFLGTDGHTLLFWGMLICIFGFAFGLAQFASIMKMPVHRAMKEISELIYATCKTYLVTQGIFLLVLEVIIGVFIVGYFGWLRHFEVNKVLMILLCSVIGIGGSYGVAWFGMRINTMANSSSAFASLKGKPFPVYAIPLQAGMSIGMFLISTELLVMLAILLFIDPSYAGPCFIGFAIGESLGASVLRIAGGIFTKIADIGSDLMKIVFNIKEDDARNPGVIADCTGDNAGDSVGPTADGFETYGVTGVALISFILLAVREPVVQVQLLVWIFSMRLMMIIASALSYGINGIIAKARYANAREMNFESPLTSLVWITSLVSIGLTFLASYLLIPALGDGTLWWKLAAIITCGTIAGAVIPELVKTFTSTESAYVQNIYQSYKKGGASLNILAGFVTGNFSAYWMGLAIIILMGISYFVSLQGLAGFRIAPSVFAFGLVA